MHGIDMHTATRHMRLHVSCRTGTGDEVDANDKVLMDEENVRYGQGGKKTKQMQMEGDMADT